MTDNRVLPEFEPRVLVVGEKYMEGMESWPEQCGVEFSWQGQDSRARLRFFLDTPAPVEVAAIESGAATFALAVDGPAIFLLYRFDPMPWGFASFSWRLNPDDAVLPETPTSPHARLTLHTMLVDTRTGLVKALRMCTLSPHFTGKLIAAIRAQAEGPFDRVAYMRHADSIDDPSIPPHRVARGLLNQAIARSHGGD